MVDASELARVYGVQREARNDVDAMQNAATVENAAATAGHLVVELAVLEAAENSLVQERNERERLMRDQEREEHGETVRDLRRRLDRAEERVLALSALPTQQPPQAVQTVPVDALVKREPAKASKGFLARLLGR